MNITNTNSEAFNIVILGAWNPAIFSPEWAKEYLAEDKTGEVVLAIPINSPINPPRLTLDGINIYPSIQMLAIDCENYNDKSLTACSNKLIKISQLLSHTPISALGINFRFIGTLDDSTVLGEIFTFGDAPKINTDKYGFSSSVIKLTFNLTGSDVILNLSIEMLANEIKMEFNFHTNIQKLNEIDKLVSIKQILEFKKIAVEFLKDVYSIELDEK